MNLKLLFRVKFFLAELAGHHSSAFPGLGQRERERGDPGDDASRSFSRDLVVSLLMRFAFVNFQAISGFKSSITFVEGDIVEEHNLHQTKKSISANLSKSSLVEPV